MAQGSNDVRGLSPKCFFIFLSLITLHGLAEGIFKRACRTHLLNLPSADARMSRQPPQMTESEQSGVSGMLRVEERLNCLFKNKRNV